MWFLLRHDIVVLWNIILYIVAIKPFALWGHLSMTQDLNYTISTITNPRIVEWENLTLHMMRTFAPLQMWTSCIVIAPALKVLLFMIVITAKINLLMPPSFVFKSWSSRRKSLGHFYLLISKIFPISIIHWCRRDNRCRLSTRRRDPLEKYIVNNHFQASITE